MVEFTSHLQLQTNMVDMVWTILVFNLQRSYRALVLQTHHQGAHISCGLVVNYDHGFLFWDWSYIITPFCYYEWGIRENPWLYTLIKSIIITISSFFMKLYIFNPSLMCKQTKMGDLESPSLWLSDIMRQQIRINRTFVEFKSTITKPALWVLLLSVP